MHADVFAGRQINQTLNKIMKNFMIKYVNPPCNSSLATSCAKFIMVISEGRVAALFTEGVSSSAEGELAIDETASTVSLAPNVCVVPGLSAAVEEGEECVGEFMSPVSGEESAAHRLEEEVDDNDSFVDIMSGITAVGVLSLRAGLLLMRWHVRIWQWRLWQKALLAHLVCLDVSLFSSFPINF